MQPPFSAEQFLDVMLRYNEAVWPMQVVFYLLAALLLWHAARRSGRDRWVGLALGFLWAWMGVAYHWIFFTEINPAAWVFGGFFVLQAALFALAAFRDVRFRFDTDVYGLTGALFVPVSHTGLTGRAGCGCFLKRRCELINCRKRRFRG